MFREQQQSRLDFKLTNVHNYLMRFDFTIIHKPENDPAMASADFFFRHLTSKSSDLDEEAAIYTDLPETVFMLHVIDQQSKENIFAFENREYNAAEFSRYHELMRNLHTDQAVKATQTVYDSKSTLRVCPIRKVLHQPCRLRTTGCYGKTISPHMLRQSHCRDRRNSNRSSLMDDF
jgi:hypothetical protein